MDCGGELEHLAVQLSQGWEGVGCGWWLGFGQDRTGPSKALSALGLLMLMHQSQSCLSRSPQKM